MLGGSQTWTNNSAATLAVNGAVSGTNALTISGTGNVVLGGANTTRASRTSTAASLDWPMRCALSGGTAAITFGGGTLQFSAANTHGDYSSRIVGSTGPISLDTNGQNVTFYSGPLASSNTAGLTKIGRRHFQRSSASQSYSGPTVISGGTLELQGGSAGGSIGVHFEGNGGSGSSNLAANGAGARRNHEQLDEPVG